MHLDILVEKLCFKKNRKKLILTKKHIKTLTSYYMRFTTVLAKYRGSVVNLRLYFLTNFLHVNVFLQMEIHMQNDVFGLIHIFQGDSGGPLVCSRNGEPWYLAGLTSFGGRCGEPKPLSVFTRLSMYIDWLNEKTSGKINIKLMYFDQAKISSLTRFNETSFTNPFK